MNRTLLSALLIVALRLIACAAPSRPYPLGVTQRTVFVHGYYRRDGTYVHSYYRRPPHSVGGGDEVSEPTLVTNSAALVELDPRSYPLGAWVDSEHGNGIQNTPFLGLSGDYQAPGVRVARSLVPEIPQGSTLTEERNPKSTTYSPALSWYQISSAAMASGQKDWWIKGVGPTGKAFEVRLKLIQDGSTSSGNSALRVTEGIFKGTEENPDPTKALIAATSFESYASPGWLIEAVGRKSGPLVAVRNWADIWRLVKGWKDDEVVISGTSAKGDPFEIALRVNPLASSAQFPSATSRITGGIFRHIEQDPNPKLARISGSEVIGIPSGGAVQFVRQLRTAEIVTVKTWSDIGAAVKRWGEKQVLLEGTDLDGHLFGAIVEVRGM